MKVVQGTDTIEENLLCHFQLFVELFPFTCLKNMWSLTYITYSLLRILSKALEYIFFYFLLKCYFLGTILFFVQTFLK